jgi:hypothetical protein
LKLFVKESFALVTIGLLIFIIAIIVNNKEV